MIQGSSNIKTEICKEVKKIGKKKVLFFLPSNTGGAERMTITLGKMLPHDQFEVKFVIVHRSLGTIAKFIPPEYEVIHIPIHNVWCAATLRMIRILRRERPDVVFSSLHYLNARLIIAAKICHVNVIIRSNIGLNDQWTLISKLLVKCTFRWADKVIAQQEEMRAELIQFAGLKPDKVITLHNPLDVDSIHQKANVSSPYIHAEGQVKYVCVGRFSNEKGQDLVVRAFQMVLKSIPNAHLYLVGKYNWSLNYDAGIKEYVNSHHLSPYIHFVGFDENPYRWVKYADCYVMPSRLEGLPNALIEAMYLKRPVVATKCIPIICRIVDDGKNGYLAETENVESIAECMKKAPYLQNVQMSYRPASAENVVRLFSTIGNN